MLFVLFCLFFVPRRDNTEVRAKVERCVGERGIAAFNSLLSTASVPISSTSTNVSPCGSAQEANANSAKSPDLSTLPFFAQAAGQKIASLVPHAACSPIFYLTVLFAFKFSRHSSAYCIACSLNSD